MKALVFDGKFSYRKNEVFSGLIVFCHIEPLDSTETMLKASRVLIGKAGRRRIILVPFAHLDYKVAYPQKAGILFENLFDQIFLSHPALIKIPFGIKKELNLSVQKGGLVSFLHFDSSHLQKVSRIYEESAKVYDFHMTKTGHYKAQKKVYEKIRPYLQSPIIDIACGPGFLLSQIEKNFSKVYANDISPSMLNLARQGVKSKNIKFLNQDATRLRGIKEKFGTLLLSNLFYYIEDKEVAIKHWKRLIKKNGRIVLIEEYPFISTKSKTFNTKKNGVVDVLSVVSPNEIITLLEHNGFKLILKTKVYIDKKHDLYGLVFSL